MFTYFLVVFFLLCFRVSNTVGNTEIIVLHRSTPVQDLPSESITIDHHFRNTFPSSSEKVFGVKDNHIGFFDDCRDCTATPADVWITFDIMESAFIPLATTVRLSWPASDAVEFDIAVFKPAHDLHSIRRYVRIRPFKIGITGNSVYTPLEALGLGPSFSKSGDNNVRFHVKVEALLWHVVPVSMLGPGAAILCLVIFGYFVVSPPAISFLKRLNMAMLDDYRKKDSE